MTLVPVSDHCDRLTIENAKVCIIIVIYLYHYVYLVAIR
jgi:hypothetical protein